MGLKPCKLPSASLQSFEKVPLDWVFYHNFPETMLVFSLFAIVLLGVALCLVFHPNPVYAAFLLVGWLVVLAVAYLGLGFEYLAMLQILVYAGAIMVLFIFTIMLLNTRTERDYWQLDWANLLSVPVLLGLFGLVVTYVLDWQPTAHIEKDFSLADIESGVIQTKFAETFYGGWFLVLESLAVLLFIGILAALALTRPFKERG